MHTKVSEEVRMAVPFIQKIKECYVSKLRRRFEDWSEPTGGGSIFRKVLGRVALQDVCGTEIAINKKNHTVFKS